MASAGAQEGEDVQESNGQLGCMRTRCPRLAAANKVR